MIRGVVTVQLRARLSLKITGPGGESRVVDAAIDTGFDGSLTLSAPTVAELNLPKRSRQTFELGGGGIHEFDIYRATIEWDGHPREVEILVADIDP